ncbi:MAG TPA: hypothetical protein DGT21_01910 [Armatimonadetes bacterium]|jgi:hypothetical protein|nr:hypothetical protein [Armatimonadota bacterium]
MIRGISAAWRTVQPVALSIVVALAVAGCPRGGTGSPDGTADEKQFDYQTLGEVLDATRRPRGWEMVISTPDGKEVGRQLARYDRGKPVRAVLSEGDLRVYMFFDRSMQVHYTPSDKSYVATEAITFDGIGNVPPADAGLYDPGSPVVGLETIDEAECWIVEGVVGRRNPVVILAIDRKTGLVRELATMNGTLKVTSRRIDGVELRDTELPEGVDPPPMP